MKITNDVVSGGGVTLQERGGGIDCSQQFEQT
jgi:hypothetical protein